MPSITLEAAEKTLEEYIKAERIVLTGQSYTIANRSLTRADLKVIRDGVDYWNDKVKEIELEASRGKAGIKIRRGVPQ